MDIRSTRSVFVCLLVSLGLPRIAAAQAAYPPPPPPWIPQGAPAPPQAPPPTVAYAQPGYPYAVATVRVRFVANEEDDNFLVTALTPSGPQSCQTPCVMELPPGPLHVGVEGSRRYANELVVPPAPAIVHVRRFHGGRLAWGIAGLSVGVSVAFLGLEFIFFDQDCWGFILRSGSCGSSGLTTTGAVLGVSGLVLAIAAAATGFRSLGRDRMEIAREDASAPPPGFHLSTLGTTTIAGSPLGVGFAF